MGGPSQREAQLTLHPRHRSRSTSISAWTPLFYYGSVNEASLRGDKSGSLGALDRHPLPNLVFAPGYLLRLRTLYRHPDRHSGNHQVQSGDEDAQAPCFSQSLQGSNEAASCTQCGRKGTGVLVALSAHEADSVDRHLPQGSVSEVWVLLPELEADSRVPVPTHYAQQSWALPDQGLLHRLRTM